MTRKEREAHPEESFDGGDHSFSSAIYSALQHSDKGMNPRCILIALDFPRPGVKLEQLIIGFAPTMEMPGPEVRRLNCKS